MKAPLDGEALEAARVRANLVLLQAEHPGPDTPSRTRTEIALARDVLALLAALPAPPGDTPERCLVRGQHPIMLREDFDPDRLYTQAELDAAAAPPGDLVGAARAVVREWTERGDGGCSVDLRDALDVALASAEREETP